MPTKIFSGIRPSGDLHLGNYLGAIKNWIELQEKADLMVFGVVDYHAITTPFDTKTFSQNVLDTACIYLATGVNPKKSLLIRQSRVPQHTELAWLFNTITPLGWIDRLPTYLEKKDQIENSGHPNAKSWLNNTGILTYPILMAADILIYKSNLLPIGDDQKAHLDVTNEIAKKFNHLFGETFDPVKMHKAEGARIKSLQDASKKMSKTGDEGLALLDNPDIIRSKIKKAVTDSGKDVKYDPEQKPAISNLLTIYHLLSEKEIKDIEEDYKGKTYSQFKEDLAEVVVNFLKPFQEKYSEHKNNPDQVIKILEDSEEKARVIAQETLDDVKRKMGLIS